jgi:hypothetical protein
VGDLVPTVIGASLSIAGGLVGGVIAVGYHFKRMELARRKERQEEALLELDELLIPIQVSLERTFPQETSYFVPPVMELTDLGTHEFGVEDVEGSEKWDEVAASLYEVEIVWRSRLRARIYDSAIRRKYDELRQTGFGWHSEISFRGGGLLKGLAK